VLRTLKFLMDEEAERQLEQRAETPKGWSFCSAHSSATNQRYRSAGIGDRGLSDQCKRRLDGCCTHPGRGNLECSAMWHGCNGLHPFKWNSPPLLCHRRNLPALRNPSRQPTANFKHPNSPRLDIDLSGTRSQHHNHQKEPSVSVSVPFANKHIHIFSPPQWINYHGTCHSAQQSSRRSNNYHQSSGPRRHARRPAARASRPSASTSRTSRR
jgi:hypothetical protein